MFTVHIWLRKKDELSAEEFRDYWLTRHAPLARDGYEHLRSYEVALVTGAPRDAEIPYDGVATLSWDDREGFSADMKSDTAKTSTDDLASFTEGFGLLFVQEETVK